MLLPGINKKSNQAGGTLGARVAAARPVQRPMAGMGDAPTGGGDPMRAAQMQKTAPMKKSNKKFFGGLF